MESIIGVVISLDTEGGGAVELATGGAVRFNKDVAICDEPFKVDDNVVVGVHSGEIQYVYPLTVNEEV